MSSILDALRRIEREEDGRTQAPFDLGPEKPPSGSRRRWLWIGGTVAIVAGLSAGLWFLGDESGEETPGPQELARAPEPDADLARQEADPEPTEVAPPARPIARKGRKHDRETPPGEGNQKKANRRQKRDRPQRAARQARRKAAAERKARRAARVDRTREPPDRPGDSPEEIATPPTELAAATPAQPRGNEPSVPAPSAPIPLAPSGPAAVAAPEPEPVAKQTTAWKRPFVNPTPSEENAGPPPDSEPAAPARPPVGTGDADAPIAVARAGQEAGVPEATAPAPAAPGAVDAGTPPADTDPSHRPRSRANAPTRTSRIERLEELKRRRSIPRDLAPAAPDVPIAEPGAPAGHEEPEEEVLQRRPTGAPRVSVNFLFYSRDAARRRIMVTVDQGSLVTLFEGQSVDTLAVERILPNEVHFRYEGKLFAVHPRY